MCRTWPLFGSTGLCSVLNTYKPMLKLKINLLQLSKDDSRQCVPHRSLIDTFDDSHAALSNFLKGVSWNIKAQTCMTAHKVWLSPPEDGQECERPPSSTSPYFELKSSFKQQVVFSLYLIKGSNGFVQFTKNIFVVAADHISYTSPHVPLLISVFFPLKEHAS